MAELCGQADESERHEADGEAGGDEASGAARPSASAAAIPVTDIANVGAITPIDTAAVSRNRNSRRSAGAWPVAVPSLLVCAVIPPATLRQPLTRCP